MATDHKHPFRGESFEPHEIQRDPGESSPGGLHPHLVLARNEDGSETNRIDRVVGRLAGLLTVAAVLGSAVLLLADAAPRLENIIRLLIVEVPRAWAWFGHAPLSAIPLLLAGASYIILQGLLRPAPMELLRRLMLGMAFLLWGIVQLMPPSALATDLGDLVIALYVFDLGLMVQAELHRA
jgi:hypothetical protein